MRMISDSLAAQDFADQKRARALFGDIKRLIEVSQNVCRIVVNRRSTAKALIVPAAAADSEAANRRAIGGFDIIRAVTDHDRLLRAGIDFLQCGLKNIRVRFGVIRIVGRGRVIDEVFDVRAFKKPGNILPSG